MQNSILKLALWAMLITPVLAEPTRPETKIKTIFDYKQELSLSDQQIASMKASLVELNDSVKKSRTRLNQLETEYKALIAQEGSTLADARAKLEQIAEVTVGMRLKDWEISRKITATLSAEQQKKWKGIQAQIRASNKP